MRKEIFMDSQIYSPIGNITVKTTTNYINGFVYVNDTLQYFPTEAGRVRYLPPLSGSQEDFVYDYFIKDHLGNTRVVLTDQKDSATYPATMESQNAAFENQLFYHINSTAETKPLGFDQNPNNQQVAELDGRSGSGNKQIGPSIVLKVMAGDTISIGTYAWYHSQVQPPPNNPPNILDNLVNSLLGSGAVNRGSHGFLNPNNSSASTLVSNDLNDFFTNKVDNQYQNTRPKAFLNYVAFDNHLQMVDDNSGVVQVPEIMGADTAQPLVVPQFIVQKSGYTCLPKLLRRQVYIYLSNESAQKVYFDNLIVHHERGPLLETENYYPYGMTMAGISDKAALRMESKHKFNGIEFNHHEFEDGSGLDLYTARFRELDPTIAQWLQIDPRPNTSISPYAGMALNPIGFRDPLGDTARVTMNRQSGRTVYLVHADKYLPYYLGNNPQYMGMTEGQIRFARNRERASAYFRGLGGFNNRFNRYSKNEEQKKKYLNAGNAVSGGAGLVYNATKYVSMEAQVLGNKLGRTSHAVQDIGNLTLIKGITVEGAGKAFGIGGMVITGYDMYENGINWSNSTDLVMEGVAFIPGVGWVISGAYFLGNVAVEHYTGKSIGEHIEEGFKDPYTQQYFEQMATSPWFK